MKHSSDKLPDRSAAYHTASQRLVEAMREKSEELVWSGCRRSRRGGTHLEFEMHSSYSQAKSRQISSDEESEERRKNGREEGKEERSKLN